MFSYPEKFGCKGQPINISRFPAMTVEGDKIKFYRRDDGGFKHTPSWTAETEAQAQKAADEIAKTVGFVKAPENTRTTWPYLNLAHFDEAIAGKGAPSINFQRTIGKLDDFIWQFDGENDLAKGFKAIAEHCNAIAAPAKPSPRKATTPAKPKTSTAKKA